MKKLILILLLLIGTLHVNAQLLSSRQAIINQWGSPTGYGVSNEGDDYIYYDKYISTEQSGRYIQRKAMYFMTMDNGTIICYMWRIVEPGTELNNNLAYYRSQFIKIDYMIYKDYSTNIAYKLYMKDGMAVIDAYCDNKN